MLGVWQRGTPVWVIVMLLATTAAAQPSATGGPSLPAAFVGSSIGPATNDASARMRLYEDPRARVWLIEAGAAVSERIGVGVEYSRPSAVKAFTTVGAGRAQISGRQEEQTLLGVVRGRLAGSGRWAVDAVGGAGVLFQHHESGSCAPVRTRCDDTSGLSVDEHAPAFMVGAQVPIRVARHFEIAIDTRAWFLRRGEHTSASDINLTWQFEWRSSTRLAALAGARFVW
jgi:hypothetical protein